MLFCARCKMRKFSIYNKGFFVVTVIILTVLVYNYMIIFGRYFGWIGGDDFAYETEHRSMVEKFYRNREQWKTSNLGSIIFKNVDRKLFEDETRNKKSYVILIWKYWKWLKGRHINSFTSVKTLGETDPLEGCPVNNCNITGDDNLLQSADAVIVHLQHGEVPEVDKRDTKQYWVFLTDESPKHSFSLAPSTFRNISLFANIFNWSMSFRSIADIPVPYGRTLPFAAPIHTELTLPKLTELIPDWARKKRDVLAAILISNCGVSRRMKYIIALRKHLNVDVHGRCAVDEKKNSCPGHFRSDCKVMSQYLFYLVFENSLCREYLTEKVFYHAYSKGAIPIIMGPTRDDCEQLLPPNSFLHIDDYKTPKDLAMDIINISRDEKRLLYYHTWRNSFKIFNEHGYFGTKSRHYCRICEALNYNDIKEKVYNENMLKLFLDPTSLCR